ncbi:hypothetical protein THAOC_14786 [Thalassiosira oceanica]|uniref:Uncharacterized protein n=1 Tax=Thalassiosira oceanica TaxID=159749 RepID=K0SGH1_THAOC|nr:hypothetical protein THAOC_14786 [Thalassiosira oceanica]|eukprot:EJK64475.1 hypothetical protein THAOC_14786 [Thalassiosira oceanica]
MVGGASQNDDDDNNEHQSTHVMSMPSGGAPAGPLRAGRPCGRLKLVASLEASTASLSRCLRLIVECTSSLSSPPASLRPSKPSPESFKAYPKIISRACKGGTNPRQSDPSTRQSVAPDVRPASGEDLGPCLFAPFMSEPKPEDGTRLYSPNRDRVGQKMINTVIVSRPTTSELYLLFGYIQRIHPQGSVLNQIIGPLKEDQAASEPCNAHRRTCQLDAVDEAEGSLRRPLPVDSRDEDALRGRSRGAAARGAALRAAKASQPARGTNPRPSDPSTRQSVAPDVRPASGEDLGPCLFALVTLTSHLRSLMDALSRLSHSSPSSPTYPPSDQKVHVRIQLRLRNMTLSIE